MSGPGFAALWAVGPGLAETRHQTDRGIPIEHQSVYQIQLHSIRKKTSIAVASFVLLLYLTFLVLGLVGTRFSASAYHSATNLTLALALRGVQLLMVLSVFYLIRREKIKAANGILILAQVLGIFTYAFFVADEENLTNLVGVLLSIILGYEIAIVLDRRRKSRLVYALTFFLIYLAIGLDYIFRVPPGARDSLVNGVVLCGLVFLAVSIPAYFSAWVRGAMEKLIEGMAYHDDVADLPNQNRLLEDFHSGRSDHWGPRTSFVLMGVYLEKMDRINHRYGYGAGNLVIQAVSRRIRELEIPLIPYRVIGPVFVLAPGQHLTAQQAEDLYPRIKQALDMPVVIEGQRIPLNFRVVATQSPQDGEGVNQLLMNLLNVIVRDPEQVARHRVEWFDIQRLHQQLRKYEIEDHLEVAFSDQEFSIMIQPKIDLRSGRVHGGEVLSRWDSAALGFVSPMEFIPVIEDSGLMSRFTRQVMMQMEQAVEHFHRVMFGRDLEELVLALNLNASTLADEEFRRDLRKFVERMAPVRIEIELTEDVFLVMDSKIVEILSDLRSVGAAVALDDFGTGFSNVSYLQDLKVNTIKIDKRFISPLPQDENAQEIVRALVSMAHAFGIDVVAEGAETAEQVALLRSEQCDIIQGYHFSRPLGVADFAAFVDGWSVSPGESDRVT